MEWFDDLGNMASLFPDTPGLAWDFALNGASPDLVGYGLAYGLQTAETPIDVYPAEGV
ncbi:hypothetical protein [Streptomyces paludis]|uniref:hypothetical protein n=1 Tax=Streptomyces paludis TaxID=2282738 RepID=UPI0013B3639C|nr:hypothetical protein [Streptomyces paludis]